MAWIKTIILTNWPKAVRANRYFSCYKVEVAGEKENYSELSFKIPGLNQVEQNYIERQVKEAFATKEPVTKDPRQVILQFAPQSTLGLDSKLLKNEVIARRAVGLLESFKVDEKHKNICLEFLNRAPEHIWRKSGKLVIPHNLMKHRLQYYFLGGGEGDLSQILGKGRQDSSKACREMTNQETFQINYRSWYLDNLSHLGLDELSTLIEPMNGTEDFEMISKTLFEKILWSMAGVSNANIIRNNSTKQRTFSLLSPLDPVNIIRNFFILGNILEMDLDTNMKHIALTQLASSLDILVTLNIWDRVLWQDIDANERRQKIIQHLQNSDGNILLEDPTFWHFPSTLKLTYLHQIGFTKEEADDILMMTSAGMITAILKEKENFLSTMKRRLNILRIDGSKVGIFSTRQISENMFHWDGFIASLEKNKKGRPKSTVGSSSAQLLHHYFDYKTFKEQLQLGTDIRKLPHSEEVPKQIVVESIQFLEKQGFSKVQMRKAVQILFYSKKILKDNLEDIRQTKKLEVCDWQNEDNALCILHYFIEKKSGFMFKDVFVGIADCAGSGLSEELIQEINKQRKQTEEKTVNYKGKVNGNDGGPGDVGASAAKTPKAPNPFALYVKENYKNYKMPGVSHGDVMKMLGDKFKEAKITNK